jgi:hypothetical protein
MLGTTSVVRAGAPVWDYFSTNVLISQVQIEDWCEGKKRAGWVLRTHRFARDAHPAG